MKRENLVLVLSIVLPVALIPWLARAQDATSTGADAVSVAGSGATVTVDRQSGHVTSILLNDAEEMATPHPAGSERPYGYLEIVDLRDHLIYNSFTAKSKIGNWHVSGTGGARQLSFAEQYDGAPFRIVHTFRPTPQGLRWEATLRLLDGQDANRSVVVTWVLPLPINWKFWGPNNLDVHETTGAAPYRYIYGHTDPSPMATVIPLVGVWGKKAGAAVFSPPDIRKTQIVFEVQTQGIADAATGVFRHVDDLQSLRVAHHMVGLRPGKDLSLAIEIAGCRPDWRGVLGHYVTSYPELFEPLPETRKYEGMYGITTPNAWQGREQRPTAQSRPSPQSRSNAQRAGRDEGGDLLRGKDSLIAARATCVEVHGHFLEYGHYIDEDLIADPNKEFTCQSHPAGPLSCAGNRRVMDEMLKAGIGPFVYFYNVHSRPETTRKRYPGETMLDEQGDPERQWFTDAAVVAQPNSAFGRNLMEQLRLLIKAYPQAPGFFVDNYSIQKIDFAHDDGVTMVHNRPCYDMNRNHQDVGTRCHEIAHQAGKIIMVNKLSTMESGKGVDMVLVENCDPQILAMHAFPCADRAFFPLKWRYSDETAAGERCLQYLLIWGATPYSRLERTLENVNAYRPLTDAMIGKRWVFDVDPLALPAGYDGQIFRIDPHAPHAGDVVVTVVDLRKSWKDAKYTDGLAVTVRLPEAGQLQKVTWLPVEKSSEGPQAVEVTRDGNAITAKLPPVGAAGVLRLSR